MTDETITLRILAQDLASGNVSKFIGGLDAMAKKGGLVGAMATGVGISIGQMLNPLALVQKGFSLVTDVVGGSIQKFEEQQVVNAQTEAALKSTGDASGETADQIEKLAGSIAGYSGKADESIQHGENLLLTFTNIKDAAGAGNDIFTQTTKVMVDMAQAMGTDASGSAIQLGKALNDPIRGLTALTRVGVTFTNEQRAQIKAMQEAGNTVGAQKIILAELNKEFGGSAEAFGKTLPGAEARFNVAIDEVEKKLGEALAGPMAALTAWLAGVATGTPPASDALQAFTDKWAAAAAAAQKANQANDQGAVSLANVTGATTDLVGAAAELGAALLTGKQDAFFASLQMDDYAKALHETRQQLAGQIQDMLTAHLTADQIKTELQAQIDAQKQLPSALKASSAAMANQSGAVNDLGLSFASLLPKVEKDAASIGKAFPNGIKAGLEANVKSVAAAAQDLQFAMKDPLAVLFRKGGFAWAVGKLQGDELTRGLHSKQPEVRAAAEAYHTALVNTLTGMPSFAWGSKVGQDYISGLESQGLVEHAFGWGVDFSTNPFGQYSGASPTLPGRHHASGGTIGMGDWGYVGESAMERVDVTPGGAVVTPLGGLGSGAAEIHLHLHTAVTPSPTEAQKFAQAFAPAIETEMRRRGSLSAR